MITGSSADRAIEASDARSFTRGHCFGKAVEEGKKITIGVSTDSKVWSNTYDRIPALLEWCDRIAEKMASDDEAITGSRLDLLSSGEELERIPSDAIAMLWPARVYNNAPLVAYQVDGVTRFADLTDFDLQPTSTSAEEIEFVISNEEITWRGRFSLRTKELFEAATNNEPLVAVHFNNEDIPLGDFISEVMPNFYCTDFSRIEGASIFTTPDHLEPFTDDRCEAVDWNASGVDISSEKRDTANGRSIFSWLIERLQADENVIVFCDDGPGEMADFISLAMDGNRPVVSFYHCKASGGPRAGNRVDDLYDVCGQAVKCCSWLDPSDLIDQIDHRSKNTGVVGFIKGDLRALAAALSPASWQRVRFNVFIVQPGALSTGRGTDISNLLAATSYYLLQGGTDNFKLIAT